MKTVPAVMALCAALVFTFPEAISGQSRNGQPRGGQRTQVAIPAIHPDLNSALVDLDRISQATQSDIATLHIEKWRSGWKNGFLKKGAQAQQAQQASGSLQRNLDNALPGLIHDVQTSRGSISTTFKLYDDLSLVCEALDSLITASESAGRKTEAASLADDYSALTRVRRALATYIQQASSAFESKGKTPYAAVAAPSFQAAPQTNSASSPTVITTQDGVRKIVIDDTVPEKKATSAPRKNQ
jgi:hypothetical protein